MMFHIATVLVAALAGAIAAISGFGVGSILTPLFAARLGTKVAVAAVSIPHLIGTAIRFWKFRHNIDKRVLWSFGITSAIGGLAGALLQSRLNSPILTIVFAALLIFVGVTGLLGIAQRIRFRGIAAWIAGATSGFLGGLVGNQGGIRSGALLGVDLPRDAFVGTATAIALFVDGARLPVYVVTAHKQLASAWLIIALASAGVIVGTIGGTRLLRRIPETIFNKLVSALVLCLGVYMFGRGVQWWR